VKSWLSTHISEDAKNVIWYVIVMAALVSGIAATVWLIANGLWWVLPIAAGLLVLIGVLENGNG